MPLIGHLDHDLLIDLFIPAVESPVPVAVLDGEGRLVGVIPRVTLLAALGPGSAATGELTLPVSPTVIDELLATSDPEITDGSTEVR